MTPEQIKAWRAFMRMPQERAAALLGINRQYLSMLETGARRPSKTLTLLMAALRREAERKTNDSAAQP